MKPGAPSLLLAVVFLFVPDFLAAGGLMVEQTVYTVREGDTLMRIGGLLGADWERIARDNAMDWRKPLRVGRKLAVSTRRIVPSRSGDGIVVNIPERMLYLYREGRVTAIPVGLGMTRCDRTVCWRTSTGPFTVTRKARNPTWYVPKSMQEEMRREGKEVLTVVPPGPENPLGRFAVYLSMKGIIIHETIWPETVYRYQSHGCIRMHPKHAETVFEAVEPGMAGEIIYAQVKAASENGRVYLEAHRDAYRTGGDPLAEAMRRIDELGASDKVNGETVKAVVEQKSGMAEDVTR